MMMMETRSRKRERIGCLQNEDKADSEVKSNLLFTSRLKKKREMDVLSSKAIDTPTTIDKKCHWVRLPMDCDYEKRLKLSVTTSTDNRAGLEMDHTISARHEPRPLAGVKRPISSYVKHRKRTQDDRYIPARDTEAWEQTHWAASNENCRGNDSPLVRFNSSSSDLSSDSSFDDPFVTSIEDVHLDFSNFENTYIIEYSALEDSKFFNEEPCRVLGFSNVDNIRNGRNAIVDGSFCSTESVKRKIARTQIDEDDPLDASLVHSPRSKTGPILSPCSLKLLSSPRKPRPKICRSPFKVLDAPELADDFYLNLVDWSSSNMLAVGLSTCVYLWNANTSAVTRLCDLSTVSDIVTGVAWSAGGEHIAVGTTRGFVQIWDVCANKQVTMLTGHTARVGALAWNDACVCSGSRDRSILVRDVRAISGTARGVHRKLLAHRQEVCGLKWSPDKQLLASGGNDNHLVVWSANNTAQPVHTFSDHIAAVKAIAWSPHQFGLLASGGGTADRRIRFWNTLTGQALHSFDTGSQVCNLAWSQHSDELVSTHGYSQNQIIVWTYPGMHQLAKLTGHTYRVLYLASAPDGRSIVTGAGDETLRFWNVFHHTKTISTIKTSTLDMFGKIR